MLNERLSQIIAESRPAFHGCDLLITDTRDRAALLSNTVGLDYRVSAERTDVLESFLEGLEFDSQRIRTFSVGIFDQSDPVGVVSLAIIPKRIF